MNIFKYILCKSSTYILPSNTYAILGCTPLTLLFNLFFITTGASELLAITSAILICIGSISRATTNAFSLPLAPAYILPLKLPNTITLPHAITLPPGLTSPSITTLLSVSRTCPDLNVPL